MWGKGRRWNCRRECGTGRHHLSGNHHWRWWGNWRIGKQLMRTICVRQRILGGQETFSRGSVSLSLRVLLEGVRNRDGSVAEILSVHGVHCGVGGLETGKVHKGESLRVARLRISHNLRRLQDNAKGREGVVQKFLVDLRVQVSNEDVRSHVQVLLVGRCLVHTNRFAVQFDHVHDLDRIIRILFAQELDESISLVHLGYSVLGHVDVHWRAG